MGSVALLLSPPSSSPGRYKYLTITSGGNLLSLIPTGLSYFLDSISTFSNFRALLASFFVILVGVVFKVLMISGNLLTQTLDL